MRRAGRSHTASQQPRLAGMRRPRQRDGPRRLRASLQWTKGRVAAVAFFIAAALGGAMASLIQAGVNQAVEPARVLDAARNDAAARITVDDMDSLVYASPEKFVPTPEDHDLLDNTGTGFMELFVRSGGVPAGSFALTLGLEGRRQQTVRIVDVRPEIVHRDQPFTGSLFLTYDAGGSDIERMALELDDPHPQAKVISEDTAEPGGPYFHSRTITLMNGEVVAVNLEVSARKAYVVFNILVEVVYGDRHEWIRVDGGGKPFSLTACAPSIYDYEAAYISEPGPIIQIDPSNWTPSNTLAGLDPLVC